MRPDGPRCPRDAVRGEFGLMSEMPSPVPSSPLQWFPEFLKLTRKRLRPQMRVMGLSLVVGVIAGLGAVVFFAACQVIFHYTLDALAGYHPTSPANEPP